MRRTLGLQMSILLITAGTAWAQSPLVGTHPSPPKHKITAKQIGELRRLDSLRQDQPTPAMPASVPGSSRGKTVESAEVLHRLLSKMSRHDRRAFFGHSKSELSGQELGDALTKAKHLVLYELDVTETDSDLPLIDVDGDGVLDQVDAIRYSDPEFSNHRLCGPTILIRRHQKLVLHLKNQLKENRQPILDWNPGSEPPSPPDPPAFWMMDAPHELFSTNIHTHGLHVSPGGGHDNAFLELPPSTSETPTEMFLDYELPKNHVAGTFWYHAHNHGSVAYQLANGMAGALIVLGSHHPDSNDLESLPEIQAANQIKHPTDSTKDVEYGRVMLLQQLVFTQTTLTTKGQDGVVRPRWIVDPADVNDRKIAPNEKNVGRIAEGIPPNKPDPDEVLAVNGQNAPSIEIQRGQIERWRLIHAGRESALNLAWYNATDLKDTSVTTPQITDAIESYEIATDGIPTGRLTKQASTDLYPGYRSDLLVRVTDKAVDGEYWLLPSEAKRLTRTQMGPVKNALPAAKLIVSGQLATPMKLPLASQLARLKRPAPDMTGAQTLNLNFTFADKVRFGVSNVAHGAGKPYAESGSTESISMPIDTPQIWNLGVREFLPGVAEAVKHPFHIHVNPFYVPALDIWKDTIVISREEVTQVHFIPTDYAGRSVLHCHILDHEDQGMMKDINIVGTSREQYPDFYQLERLATKDQIRIGGLSLEQGKNNVLVFVTGMGCPHCVEGVIKLWKRSDPLKDLDATIKCMSATPFKPKELASLGLSTKDHFTFHSVPEDFDLAQCDAQPQLSPTKTASLTPTTTASNPPPITHGVLIFDKQQNLRYRYLGDRPISDLDEITYALMELKDPAPSPKGRFHHVSLPK